MVDEDGPRRVADTGLGGRRPCPGIGGGQAVHEEEPFFRKLLHDDGKPALILHESGAHVVIYPRDVRDRSEISLDLPSDLPLVHVTNRAPSPGFSAG